MNFSARYYHSGKLVCKLGNSTIGHFYTESYDDYHVYSESQISSFSGVGYKGAGTNQTLEISFAYAPVGITACIVRNYHLEYIGHTSNSDYKRT